MTTNYSLIDDDIPHEAIKVRKSSLLVILIISFLVVILSTLFFSGILNPHTPAGPQPIPGLSLSFQSSVDMCISPEGYKYHFFAFDLSSNVYFLEGSFVDTNGYSWNLNVTCHEDVRRELKVSESHDIECYSHTEQCAKLFKSFLLLDNVPITNVTKNFGGVECIVYESNFSSWCFSPETGFVYEYCDSQSCLLLSNHKTLKEEELQVETLCPSKRFV
ncbi:hypothetical protein P9112_005568 [Eukaryota sp. TZLM1-RC]